TLTIGSLDASAGGDLLFDLLGTGAGSFDVLHVTGNATFGAATTISIQPGASTGHYVILPTDGTVTGLPHLSSATGGRNVFTLDTSNANAIAVDVVGNPASLIWKGTQNSNWDIQTSQNWLNGASTDFYFEGDNVSFNDRNNGHYAVNLDALVHPSSTTFDNSSGDYTLSSSAGTGAVTGVGALTKSGSSALILATNNSYSGTTTINGGTLQLGAGTTSGSVGGGNVINNANLTINRSDAVTLGNAVSGAGSLTKLGGNTVILSGNSTYTGITTIAGGTLQIGGGTTSGSLGTGNVINNGVLALK